MKSLRAVAIALLLSVPGAAAADYYYEYETDEGVMSYTDDLRRVPNKYRQGAQRQKARPLFDYDRATIVKKGASIASAETIFGNDLLGGNDLGIDWSMANRPQSQQGPSGTSPRLSVDVGSGMSLDIDTNEGPIYVERRQYKDADGNFIVDRNGVNTEHTVVRQGDKDLVYIDDRGSNH